MTAGDCHGSTVTHSSRRAFLQRCKMFHGIDAWPGWLGMEFLNFVYDMNFTGEPQSCLGGYRIFLITVFSLNQKFNKAD